MLLSILPGFLVVIVVVVTLGHLLRVLLRNSLYTIPFSIPSLSYPHPPPTFRSPLLVGTSFELTIAMWCS